VPTDDQHGSFAEEGVDPGRSICEHEEQSELRCLVGMACGAHIVRAGAGLLSDSRHGDRSVAVHDTSFRGDVERCTRGSLCNTHGQ
jgi:hypothetical protein